MSDRQDTPEDLSDRIWPGPSTAEKGYALPRRWHGKPYYSLDAFCKNTYGGKLYKIALDAGCGCPNRDGTAGLGGCIFCSAGGSGEFAVLQSDSVSRRLEKGKALLAGKWRMPVKAPLSDESDAFAMQDGGKGCGSFPPAGLIAYFQSYTNTYGDPDRLTSLFREALLDSQTAGISIATRPDCLSKEIGRRLDLLKRSFPDKFIWIELGLQTIHSQTAALINRGYDTGIFYDSMKLLHDHGFPAIVHLILGLPGENSRDMLSTINAVNETTPFGVKLQLLHVLKGTKLARLYESKTFQTLAKEEYLELVTDCIAHLSPDICIHRLTGDGPRELLIAPLWSLHKKDVLNGIHKAMKQKDIRQGSCYEPGTTDTL